MNESLVPDPKILLDLAHMRMPFGRYKGRLMVDLPEPYVVWFRAQGFPRGRLGEMFGLLYEIKANGLEHLVRELARRSTAGKREPAPRADSPGSRRSAKPK